MKKYFVEKITDNFYILRFNDADIKFFEALWEIPEGITYNSYILLGEEKNVLFDGWKMGLEAEFEDAISKVVDIRDIDLVVAHHMEPDHSGTLPFIINKNREAKVLCHPMAKQMFRSFYGIDERIMPVKDSDKIDAGGFTLAFHFTPWLHWPETIMTFIEEPRILVSGDAFGGYSIPEAVVDENDAIVEKYLPFVRKYLYTVIGNYIRHIPKNLEKLSSRGVKPRIIAPAHGLVFKNKAGAITNYYMDLASGKSAEKKTVIIYDSMYGFVESMIDDAVSMLKKRGVQPIVFKAVDDERFAISDVVGEAGDAENIILGVSTYEAGVFPLMDYIAKILIQKVKSKKKVLIISSYGWGGVAAKKIMADMDKIGHEIVDVIEFKGAPTPEHKKALEKAIEKLVP